MFLSSSVVIRVLWYELFVLSRFGLPAFSIEKKCRKVIEMGIGREFKFHSNNDSEAEDCTKIKFRAGPVHRKVRLSTWTSYWNGDRNISVSNIAEDNKCTITDIMLVSIVSYALRKHIA